MSVLLQKHHSKHLVTAFVRTLEPLSCADKNDDLTLFNSQDNIVNMHSMLPPVKYLSKVVTGHTWKCQV